MQNDLPQAQALIGLWRVARVIADHRAGLSGHFKGEARFWDDGAGLAYREEGQLTYGHALPMTATRAYHWRRAGAIWRVFFEDGRPFHDIAQGGVASTHLCAPDTYEGRYDFATFPEWRSTITVSGPKKDMVLTTTYAPL